MVAGMLFEHALKCDVSDAWRRCSGNALHDDGSAQSMDMGVISVLCLQQHTSAMCVNGGVSRVEEELFVIEIEGSAAVL